MPAQPTPNDALHRALAQVAPGTALRDGIDRVVRANMGALLVLSDDPRVLAICSGGFLLDAEYTPQRLSELAKMDGAIILTTDGTRIARANVHLVPDPTAPTSETGTRHRTAERVALSLSVPVVSVSEEMSVINVYAGGIRRQLNDVARLLDRSNQALQTLERYKTKLDDATSALTSLEIEDVVTVRDVAAVVQRGEMVRQIAAEIETMIVELGVDARLLRLQLEEVFTSLDNELELVIADYPTLAHSALSSLDGDLPASPKGLRMLARVPRLSDDQAEAIAEHFGELAKLLRATSADIARVPGISAKAAHAVKETLERLTESTILDQYI
ncbi:MAG: DNA integrity scanning diadenylate cyclase DisA [Actinomycetota bacterium]|nr:DNA integrity scanning diadenylate cyclase DisA [Actinomycetota bacterium]